MIYVRRSRLSARVQQRLLEHFVTATTARAAAALCDVQVHTAVVFYQRLRKRIASKLPSYDLSGEVEADESYFGGRRRGKRGRGAAGKVPVFGLLKRGGKVYTAIIPDVTTSTLLAIIEERVQPDSIVYTDCFGAYDALNVAGFRHERINHSKLFADQHNHINGIENFWK